MTTYTDSANGVTYTITQTGGNDITGFIYKLVVVEGGVTTATVTGIPEANILTANGALAPLLASGAYVIPPTITGSFAPVAMVGATTLYVGGTATLTPLLAALDTLTVNVQGGAATLSSGLVAGLLGSTTVNIADNGTFSTGASLASVLNGSTLNFEMGGGTLIANGGGALIDLSGMEITGFNAATDNIELENLVGNSTVTSYTVSGTSAQTIDFFNGTTELGTVVVTGSDLTTGTFGTTGTGPLTVLSGSSELTFDPVPSTLCFLGGTNIATPSGEIAVETIKIGDLILTADGRTVPVRWVGINTVSTRFADPLRFMPIRIQAGALADNAPTRDLLLSPDHAIFMDGVLVQAGALVNGITITQEVNMPARFIYYHVETEDHSLILAEGAVAETFIDNVDRMAFENWEEHEALYGNQLELVEMPYPRAKSARQVPMALRDRLAGRIEVLNDHMRLSA
jgi:hypothetical protein